MRAVLHVLDEPQFDATAPNDAPLAGVPYVLKDTWDTAGIPTTGGSWRHRDRVPDSSSHAYRAFSRAGAVLLGKSNLCDLSFSVESDNHLRGAVRNPWDPSRTAGGSTGGGAAAVATGMAAFDWGTDFGGSIRGPAAFCGVVGMRLSASIWPVGEHHFPRIAPAFWEMCGMGPIASNVERARAVVRAVRSELRSSDADVAMDENTVALFLPDRAHAGAWPTFERDARDLSSRAGLAVEPADLPTPSAINALYTEFLAAHFGEFFTTKELSLRDGLAAVTVGLASRGRLDKRIHPNTGILLLAVAALSLVHRDRARTTTKLASLKDATARIWDRKRLIVTATCTEKPPRHGRAAFSHRLMSFCKLGNLVDATAIAIPFGTFPGSPALPRSLQIVGPPGSEESVFRLAERLERTVQDGASARISSNIANAVSADS